MLVLHVFKRKPSNAIEKHASNNETTRLYFALFVTNVLQITGSNSCDSILCVRKVSADKLYHTKQQAWAKRMQANAQTFAPTHKQIHPFL